MGIRIKPVQDDRAQKIIDDPVDYYSRARERIRKTVEREVEQERKRGR